MALENLWPRSPLFSLGEQRWGVEGGVLSGAEDAIRGLMFSLAGNVL